MARSHSACFVPSGLLTARREREVCPELLRVLAHDVGWPVALNAPALGERADVDGVETELVVELRHQFDGLRAVTGGGEGSPVLRPSRGSVCRDVRGEDVIEALGDLRGRQML